MKLSRRVVLSLPLATAFPARAQAAWTIATEYPASAMPGEGIAFFADAATRAAGGALQVMAAPNAPQGIRSAAMPAAVADGRLQAACAFTGAMANETPLFGLSALPFLTASAADAARLLAAARPAYAETLAARGLTLLYATPWPPSGIWSRQALPDEAALRGLKIRTFDATSTQVFAAAGAQPAQISFADAMPRLRAGELDAVLSSGDGGAGARLWEVLPHFTTVEYAWPLSLAFCSTAALGVLPAAAQAAVREAARATETRQWQAIGTRLAENTARMRAAEVRMADGSAALRRALRAAAAPAVDAWAARTGEAGARVLAAYRG
jgi:TRAP-type C4-dicarboxylate transport system substrate-binding protein